MKKQLIYITSAALLFAAMLVTISCHKVLDLEPHNSTFTAANFKTENDAKTANAGSYALLRRALLSNGAWHTYGDVAAGGLNCDADAWRQYVVSGQFVGLNVQSYNWNWKGWYQILQQVNLMILKIPEISDDKFISENKNHIIGEAYFMRAYVYFFMSRVWGDVPLKLEPDLEVSTAKNLPRTAVDSVLNQCLLDVAKAESLLDWGYTDESQRAVRANKGSAYALEAHIRAWRHDYAGAEIAANEVITKGGYKLLDSSSYKQVFQGKSVEGIFEININNAQSEGIAMINSDGSYDMSAYTMAMPIIPQKRSLEWKLDVPFNTALYPDTLTRDPDDPDQTAIHQPDFVDTLNDVRYRNFYYQARKDPDPTDPNSNVPPNLYQQITKFSNFNIITVQVDIRLSNNIPIFRLADIILLRAEALDSLGRFSEARTLLDQVRSRAGLYAYSGTDDELKTGILKERLRELFFEGQSYYDLVRTKRLPEFNPKFPATQFSKASPSGGWLWPVDPALFKDDYTLIQTPYWRGQL